MKKSILIFGLFILCSEQKSFCQPGAWLTFGNNAIPVNILGTNTGGNNLYIHSGGVQSIFISGITHYVGMGVNFIAPNYLLDVSGPNGFAGNIDIANPFDAYCIGGTAAHNIAANILWVNGNFTNLFCGSLAGNANAGYSRTTLVGNYAGNIMTAGANDNTAMGYHALLSNTTGNNNTALGSNANVASPNLTNATAIGANALATKSNSVVMGNTDVKHFVFNGDLEPGLNNAGKAGQVLTSQGAGNAPQWQTPSDTSKKKLTA